MLAVPSMKRLIWFITAVLETKPEVTVHFSVLVPIMCYSVHQIELVFGMDHGVAADRHVIVILLMRYNLTLFGLW